MEGIPVTTRSKARAVFQCDLSYIWNKLPSTLHHLLYWAEDRRMLFFFFFFFRGCNSSTNRVYDLTHLTAHPLSDSLLPASDGYLIPNYLSDS